MMSVTHAILGVCGASLLLQTADPVVLGLSIIGSQIPDLDSSRSLVGQVFFPVSHWLEDRYPHRTITHCLLFNLCLVAIAWVLWYILNIPTPWAIALPLGHLLAIFSDTFTKQGVQLFYPLQAWCVCGMNPKRRMKTGGKAEYWVLGIAVLILFLNFNLLGSGGFRDVASRTLNLKDHSIKAYNANAATHATWLHVEGVWVEDRRPVNQDFFIVAENNGYLVTDGQGIYKVARDGDIIPTLTRLDIRNEQTTETFTQGFNDEPLGETLEAIAQRYSNSLVLVSGSVTIDFPDELPSSLPPEVQVYGTRVNLTYADLNQVLSILQDQWAIGQLDFKVFAPAPTFSSSPLERS
ncbi:metal-dependent hydrolase [Picosynechococcus sp. NKBG15041c]|uniref:metal-dependent hydrolase n=1 Tax=Picosynechococcus sp. NKBG15041c TaxID=1407650 RepID=UPI0003FA1C0E|nr:metal-dependent hydrolase [Picosynechococcus sp. NKBG15041c]